MIELIEPEVPEIKLNKVDLHIKAMMLAYPTLYATRMEALYGIFVRRDGHHWNSKGCLISGEILNPSAPMDYSDLDEEAQELTLEIQNNKSECLMPLLHAQRVDLKRRYALRRLVEEDIDCYATEHVTGDNEKYGVEWLKDFYPQFSLAFEASQNVSRFDREWIYAAEEVMTVVKMTLWRALHMHLDHYMDKGSTLLREKYDWVVKILESFDAVTGTLSNQKEIMQSIELA